MISFRCKWANSLSISGGCTINCAAYPNDLKVKGLDYDSVDDITDLEEKGILTTSGHLLSEQERKNLKQYKIKCVCCKGINLRNMTASQRLKQQI